MLLLAWCFVCAHVNTFLTSLCQLNELNTLFFSILRVMASYLAPSRGPHTVQVVYPDAFGAHWTLSAKSRSRSTSGFIFIWSQPRLLFIIDTYTARKSRSCFVLYVLYDVIFFYIIHMYRSGKSRVARVQELAASILVHAVHEIRRPARQQWIRTCLPRRDKK